MRPPCETIVSAILPAIRSILARELVENFSMSQVKVAKLLGTTQPAISQYLAQKRGDQLTNVLRSMPEVKHALQEIVDGIEKEEGSPRNTVGAICSICMSLRRDGTVCEWHECDVEKPEKCKICH